MNLRTSFLQYPSMMNTLKIGLAQVRQTGSFEKNLRTIFRYLDKAADAGVQIVCFPEAQSVGYRADISTADAAVPVAELQDLHQRVAERCGKAGMACILGTEIPRESDPYSGKPYNSVVVVSENGELWGRITRPGSLHWTLSPTLQVRRLKRSICSA